MDKAQLDQLFVEYSKTRDVALRNKIAEEYFYIAEILAKKFMGRGVEYDDLYQVAALALVKGVERFNPELGLQFTTFITPTITGEIKNYFRDKSRAVKLPRKLVSLRAEIKKAQEKLSAETGKIPTLKELADVLGVEEETLITAMEVGGTISLDAVVSDEDGRPLSEVIPDKDDYFEKLEDKDALQSATADFAPIEKELLNLRYGQGLSQVETAKRLNVSQMFVSRMERKLLQRLRERLQDRV